MKGISLFFRHGWLDVSGMKMAGIDVVAYSEIDKKFCETHEKNFPESRNYRLW